MKASFQRLALVKQVAAEQKIPLQFDFVQGFGDDAGAIKLNNAQLLSAESPPDRYATEQLAKRIADVDRVEIAGTTRVQYELLLRVSFGEGILVDRVPRKVSAEDFV